MAYLHKRGYNQHFLRQEITRAKIITRKEALLPKSATTITTDKSECVPFILTRNPALRSISSVHHSQTHKHFNLIPSLPQHIQVYTYCCLPTRQQPHQLSCTNLTTQPFTKQHTPRGFFLCGSHCSTCTYTSNGLTSYTFHSTDEAKPITHHITCNSKSLIHMIQCNAVTINI